MRVRSCDHAGKPGPSPVRTRARGRLRDTSKITVTCSPRFAPTTARRPVGEKGSPPPAGRREGEPAAAHAAPDAVAGAELALRAEAHEATAARGGRGHPHVAL